MLPSTIMDADSNPTTKVAYLGSLIIPTLNEAEHITENLRALHLIRQHGWKIIVVDGGSADATLACCCGLADVLLTTSAGRANQMNVGALEAAGEVLVFLHADTRLPVSFDLELRHFLQSDKQWGRFDVQLSNARWPFRMIAWFINHRSRLTSIATGDQVLFFRSTFFQKIGGFPMLTLMEDVAVSRRSKALSKPFCIKAKVITSSRRWERYGIVKTIVLMWALRLAFALGVPAERLHEFYYGR